VKLADEKVEQPSHQRVYLVPSYTTAKPGEAEALELLGHLLGGGQTSLLYRKLVVEQKIAVMAGAYYMGTALDDTRFWVYAMPAPEITLEALDEAVRGVIAEVAEQGVDADDLARAKTRLIADAVYAQDSQAMLARWYGAALTTGTSVKDIREWPQRMDAVSDDAVRDACRNWLDPKRAVTGFLLPQNAA
jgi:zinc protease